MSATSQIGQIGEIGEAAETSESSESSESSKMAGKTALVTGGGSGIGRALARALAARGASVVVADILKENAQSVASEIRRDGGSASAVFCDVSDRESVRTMKAEARAAFGTISHLFANAGVTSFQRLCDLSEQEVDWVIQVDLLGVFHCLQAFLPDMIAQRAGHVVATASVVGLVPSKLPYHSPYCAAKAGVIAAMLNLRAELSEHGIGCTVLCPGGVTTRIHETPRYRPARFGGPADETVKPVEGYVPTGKIQFRPAEDVAEMVMRAVRENRPLVVTDATQREEFLRGYADVVLSAFDDAARFDRER